MTRAALAVLVVLALVHSVRAQNPDPARAHSIHGVVVDATNGVPLRRARVVVSAAQRRFDSVFTDDEGRFAIADLPAAPLTVRATKAGFAVLLMTVPAAGTERELRIAMMKSAAVSGRVLDSLGGSPVGGT